MPRGSVGKSLRSGGVFEFYKIFMKEFLCVEEVREKV